jgi:hypothetical protein
MATREEKLKKIENATLEIEQYLTKEGFSEEEKYIVILTAMQKFALKMVVK